MSIAHSAVVEDLLAIVPPYASGIAPAGPAYLIGALEQEQVFSFRFLDIKLHTNLRYKQTYRSFTPAGRSFVLDIPDLPLVMRLLTAHESGRNPITEISKSAGLHCQDHMLDQEDLMNMLSSVDRDVRTLFSPLNNLRFVGFSVWTTNYLTTLIAAAHLKRRRNAPFIVAGGPQLTESTATANLALKSDIFDVIITGEGERSLVSVYKSFRENRTIQSDPSILTKHNAEPRKAKVVARKMLQGPLPSFDSFNLSAYSFGATTEPSIPYQTSRGCTDKCVFCSEWVFWSRYRSTIVEKAIDELRWLSARHGIYRFQMVDSLLNGSPHRFENFLDCLNSSDLQIRWSGFLRADINLETSKNLSRSGFDFCFIGVESMSDDALASMNKRRTGNDNIQSLEALLTAEIRVRAGIIPGFPGDTTNAVTRTIHEVRKLQDSFPGMLNVAGGESFTLSPGMPMYGKWDEYGLKPHYWPAEVLDILPKYSSLLESVVCEFSGDNQGQHKLKQTKILKSAQWKSGDMWHSELYDYSLSVSQPNFIDLDDLEEKLLLRPFDGKIHGILCTSEETSEISRNAADLNSVFRDVEKKHFLISRNLEWSDLRYVSVTSNDWTGHFQVSPFTIGRVFKHNDRHRCVVANIRQRKAHEIDVAFGLALAGALRNFSVIKEAGDSNWLEHNDPNSTLSALKKIGVIAPISLTA